jgi:ABC-type amino acid transport substrate-binding protein
VRSIPFLILLTGFLAFAPYQGNAESAKTYDNPGKMKSTLQAVRARGKLIAGVINKEPPLGFVDKDGVLKGLEVDLAAALARKIFSKEDRVELVPAPIGKWVDLLKSGKIDILLAPVFISEDQRREIDYSIPCFVSGGLILVEKDSKIKTPQELAEKTVATIRGTMGETMIRESLPKSKPVLFPNNADALRALKEHKVDAFAQLDIFVFYMEEKDKSLGVVDLKPFAPSPIRLGVRKGDKEWRDFVDIELLEMMTTGEYRKLLDKWFGRIRGEFLERSLKNEIRRER